MALAKLNRKHLTVDKTVDKYVHLTCTKEMALTISANMFHVM